MLESRLENHPHREELIEEASGALFYGIPVNELSREDLLMMVGHLSREHKREQRWQDQGSELRGEIRRAIDRLGE